MKIYLVSEHGNNIQEIAKYLKQLDAVAISNILIFTAEEKDALLSATIIKDIIGIGKIGRRHWLGSCKYYSDNNKYPFVMRKIDVLIIESKGIKRMIFVTHLAEIKQILKWSKIEKYKISLYKRIKDIEKGALISMNNAKMEIKQIF